MNKRRSNILKWRYFRNNYKMLSMTFLISAMILNMMLSFVPVHFTVSSNKHMNVLEDLENERMELERKYVIIETVEAEYTDENVNGNNGLLVKKQNIDSELSAYNL